jgi:hypothetical protein
VIRLKRQLLIRQHAERRDDVFFKILVLVITPHQDEVGLEGVDLLTDFPKGVEDAGAMRFMGCNTFVIAPFQAHRLWPVGGVFHMGGNTWVALEHTRQRPRFVLFRDQSWWIMGCTDA